jgi:4-amino-4-deoxy-L-arabinose transferase-like glycosyltransferase
MWNRIPKNNTLYLGIITLLAAGLRIYHLDYQSLWLDELYTLRECDPALSWSETIDLVNKQEMKSPLYFLIIKLFFKLFGYSSMVARSVSVIAGIVSIPAIYLLGKELFNSKTGLIAALLSSVNSFLIFYSQEARGYELLFLFSTISLLYFLRLLKNPGLKNSIIYGVAAILALHFHINGALLVMAQFVLGLYYFIKADRVTRANYLKWFSVSVGIFIIGFLPTISTLQATTAITSSWIPMPAPSYFVDYFHEFFGLNEFLKPILILAIFSYLYQVFVSTTDSDKPFAGISFSFIFILTSLAIVFMVPFLYSVLKTPSLSIRYMMIAFPYFLLVISAGISYIGRLELSALVGLLFVSISLVDTIVIKEYYTKPNKTQFREMTDFIIKYSDKPYPIVNEKTAFQHWVYLKMNGAENRLLPMTKEAFIDSLLNENFASRYPAFWLAGGHIDPQPGPEKVKILEKRYVATLSKNFYDAWAQLYIRTDASDAFKWDFRNFDQKNFNVILGDSIVSIWDNAARVSLPYELEPGDYTIKLLTSGTPFKSVYSHLNVHYNDSLLGSFYTQEGYALSPSFSIHVPKRERFVLKIEMDNDENDSNTNEDRNALLKAIYFTKK